MSGKSTLGRRGEGIWSGEICHNHTFEERVIYEYVDMIALITWINFDECSILMYNIPIPFPLLHRFLNEMIDGELTTSGGGLFH